MDTPALSSDDQNVLVTYVRQKFAQERWPLSPSLRPIREALEKFDPKPEPDQPRKPSLPRSPAQRKKVPRGSDLLDFMSRAALGIAIGAMLAVLISTLNAAFAATVGLANADAVAANVMLVASTIWFLCRWIQVRR